MPKEITHWIIANRIHEQMAECPLKSCLSENIHMYYIGAVAFDTPYYLNGTHYSLFQDLASRLHGIKGENTFDPIIMMFRSYDEKIPWPDYAFLCGVITHIMIDSAFHPLVYYLTGDYNDPEPSLRSQAVISHRQWEAGLDLHLSEYFFIQDPGWLKRCLNSSKINQDELLDCLCMLYFMNSQACRRQVKKALESHANWMNKAARRSHYYLYKAASLLGKGRLDPVLASFYPAAIHREYYKQDFEYYHDGWGEQRIESIMDIEQRAIVSSLDLLGSWINLPDGEEAANFLKGLRGPSLETGV
ncbi:MAG: zinc dependent phospholipase C family protein [Syntrophomonas sp.]